MKEERFKYKDVSVDLVRNGGKWFYVCNARKKVTAKDPDLPRISSGWFETEEEARKNAKSEIDRIIKGA